MTDTWFVLHWNIEGLEIHGPFGDDETRARAWAEERCDEDGWDKAEVALTKLPLTQL